MYRLNADLSDESFTIGRARAFSPGWLENGSIWLHMEYKYLLELLRSGLYDEFYTAAQSALIPYLKPEVYGRSILENSSFILSSLKLIVRIMGAAVSPGLVGPRPCSLVSGLTLPLASAFPAPGFGTCLSPQPVLRGDFFTEEPQKVAVQAEPI